MTDNEPFRPPQPDYVPPAGSSWNTWPMAEAVMRAQERERAECPRITFTHEVRR